VTHEREDLSPAPPAPGPGVTDDDRHRYGRLLDRAAERGLLDSHDYEVRLRDLASASTVDEMNRIVAELPAFTSVPAGTSRTRARGPVAGRPTHRPAWARPPRRSSPWLLLVIVVVVVAASLVFLSLYAGHLVHHRNSGLAPASVPAGSVSALRP
jgi:Domain of unknown function (DUF1707)